MNKRLKIIKAIVLLIILIIITPYVYHKTIFDDPLSIVFSMLFKEDTQYAPLYNEKSFRKIRKGDSIERVLELIGPPLDQKIQNDEIYYWYTRSPGRTHYWFRLIIFGKDKKVKGIEYEFYVD